MDAWCELNCVAEASAFFEGLLQQGASIAQIMKRRSEIVTLSLVQERTDIRRKPQGARKHNQRAEALASGDETLESVIAARKNIPESDVVRDYKSNQKKVIATTVGK